MLMFLSIFVMGLLAVGVCAGLMSVAAGQNRGTRSETDRSVAPSKFFIADDDRRTTPQASIPIEVVLSQIERHVRLEQIVAERFSSMPTPESLKSPSDSPLAN